jgi:hypothetical protein
MILARVEVAEALPFLRRFARGKLTVPSAVNPHDWARAQREVAVALGLAVAAPRAAAKPRKPRKR